MVALNVSTAGCGYIINGETLVTVKGCGALAFNTAGTVPGFSALGLSDKQVRIEPRFYHKDVYIDDFGPQCPPEVQWLLAEVRIEMTLIWYDPLVLQNVLAESMGGSTGANFVGTPGTLVAAGTMMGRGLPLQTLGNHYISLTLQSPVLGAPWHFPSAYVCNPPMVLPLGTQKSILQLNWRAIPYASPLAQRTVLSTVGGESITIKNPNALLQLGELVVAGKISQATYDKYEAEATALVGDATFIIPGNETITTTVSNNVVSPQEMVSAGAVLWDNIADTGF